MIKRPKSELYKLGTLRGVEFTFVDVGDELELHSHDEKSIHCTFVRKDSEIRILREDGKFEDVGPGTFKIFEPGEVHGYKALKAGSRILNITYGS